MNSIFEKIHEIGIVPVIALDDAEKAVPLAKALIEGGIPCAEITFRTACAEEAIRKITSEVPEMLVGAGTVLTREQLDRAVDAGSKFIVSPGFNPNIIKYAQKKNVLMIPGTAVPGEMEQAMELGLEVVKFFPAESNGGISMLKAVSAPYRTLKFMPTGGINENNITDYIVSDNIVACGGSWMVNNKLIADENYAEITRLAKQAVKTMLGFKVAHIGINCADSDKAMQTAKMLSTMFGFDIQDGEGSIFAGSRAIEILKTQYLGEKGHIAIQTNSLSRAIPYLKNKGFNFNESTINANVAYLKDELAGFAIHLVQKK